MASSMGLALSQRMVPLKDCMGAPCGCLRWPPIPPPPIPGMPIGPPIRGLPDIGPPPPDPPPPLLRRSPYSGGAVTLISLAHGDLVVSCSISWLDHSDGSFLFQKSELKP